MADLIRRLGRGSVAGAAVGVICLAVGLVRVALYLLSGGRIAGFSAADVREMAFYVGGFTVAGSLIAATWPLCRGRVGEYVTFAFGGAIVGIAIVLGESGAKPIRTSDWIIGITIGSLLGCAFAHGWRKGPS